MSNKEPVITSLRRNAMGQLELCLANREEPVRDVRVSRCFPRSLPDGYVSIRDKEGKELVLLTALDGLDDGVRRLIDEELYDKIFTPRIRRIVSSTRDFGIVSVLAETDRGEVTFQIRNRDDVQILSATQLVFRDADGNAYEVEDAEAMDKASREFLREYV